ncbi:MAG TPA: TniB family NTP-binding protein [Methylophilaceae bacterium]|nr:TniB family NTP-binding protein [Methylophilaceae bacterium]
MSENSTTKKLDDLFVVHTRTKEALDRLNSIYKRAAGRGKPTGITLTGESGTGKTELLEDFASQYPSSRLEDKMQISVLLVTVPAIPNSRNLAAAILEAMGAPEGSERESEAHKTRRVIELFKAVGVKMLILEEYQHFADKTDKSLVIAADWLKVLLDKTKIIVVISGLPTTRLALEKNEQLARRFSAQIEMSRFDWKKESDRIDFRRILHSFQSVMDEFSLPKLASEEYAFRFFIATGGLICHIKTILVEATWICMDKKSSVIELDDFAVAWQNVISIFAKNNQSNLNPFRATINLLDTIEIEKLISFSKRIGSPNV